MLMFETYWESINKTKITKIKVHTLLCVLFSSFALDVSANETSHTDFFAVALSAWNTFVGCFCTGSSHYFLEGKKEKNQKFRVSLAFSIWKPVVSKHTCTTSWPHLASQLVQWSSSIACGATVLQASRCRMWGWNCLRITGWEPGRWVIWV